MVAFTSQYPPSAFAAVVNATAAYSIALPPLAFLSGFCMVVGLRTRPLLPYLSISTKKASILGGERGFPLA